ncbi:MAG: hypothetical protein ACJAWV_003003 [Flammeovirgaceae bacterium]|jgi:hypothetical protein
MGKADRIIRLIIAAIVEGLYFSNIWQCSTMVWKPENAGLDLQNLTLRSK